MKTMLKPEPQTAAAPVAAVRSHVWIKARHFFRRTDAQSLCWLWLLDATGRVHALRLSASWWGRDDLLPACARHLRVEPDQPWCPGGHSEHVWPLRNAPVVPVPRWAVSWGHPLQRAIRAFAACLDDEVLAVLGRLEAPGPFFGSVANYNRLATLPPTVRSRRIQALDLFPPLVAPVLLDAPGKPEMFNSAEEDMAWHAACAPAGCHPVLQAMDRGRDLIGALADFHRVDRALVRMPTFREPWQQGRPSRALLHLLAAMPAPQRPATRAALERYLPWLDALAFDWQQPADAKRVASAFAQGWERTWRRVKQAAPSSPRNALADTRDFLRAAREQAEPGDELAQLEWQTLGVAWVARRGLTSLVAASLRWHEQPLGIREPEAPVDAENDPHPDQLIPIFGTWHNTEGVATECTSRALLRAEGEAMHHCVGDYWDQCRLDGDRIVHLELADGSRATAQYQSNGIDPDPGFSHIELRGPCNADCAMPVDRFARQVEAHMNSDACRAARALAVQQVRRRNRVQARAPKAVPRTIRRLDARSRHELRQVLGYCRQQSDWRARWHHLYRGPIAGLVHGEGAMHLGEMDVGDVLRLVPEPENPHDRAAVRVDWRGHKLGYLPCAQARVVAPLLDAGTVLHAVVAAVRDADEWDPVDCMVTRDD